MTTICIERAILTLVDETEFAVSFGERITAVGWPEMCGDVRETWFGGVTAVGLNW